MSENRNIPDRFLVSFPPADCRPSVEEVVRYLGGAGYQPRPTIRKRVDKALVLAEGLVAPAVTFSLLPVLKTDDTGVLLDGGRHIAAGGDTGWQQAAYIAVSVATLGPGLEGKCHALSGSEPFSAIVLDAVGTAFLDRLGEMVLRETMKQARIRGLYCGTRISPGLQNVDLHLQHVLFDLVDHQALGVTLTEDLIMVPFKSISEFRSLAPRPCEPSSTDKCTSCDFEGCQFRRSAPERGHLS